MQQVLEAPETQDHEYIATAEVYPAAPSFQTDAKTIEAADKTRQPFSLWRSILAIFVGPEPQYIPACADTRAQYDTAVEHISRVDPYLYIKALSG